MLVTDENQGWSEKVNFTDANDVFVGFDMSACCCEDFGWYVSTEVTTDSESERVEEFDGYVFDTTFFEEIGNSGYDYYNYAVFKLVKDGERDLYLHLYNSHNGYYSHGFTATVGGQPWQDGSL